MWTAGEKEMEDEKEEVINETKPGKRQCGELWSGLCTRRELEDLIWTR